MRKLIPLLAALAALAALAVLPAAASASGSGTCSARAILNSTFGYLGNNNYEATYVIVVTCSGNRSWKFDNASVEWLSRWGWFDYGGGCDSGYISGAGSQWYVRSCDIIGGFRYQSAYWGFQNT